MNEDYIYYEKVIMVLLYQTLLKGDAGGGRYRSFPGF